MRFIIFDFGSVCNLLKAYLGAPQLWLSLLNGATEKKKTFITDDETHSISETLHLRRPKMTYSKCRK